MANWDLTVLAVVIVL